MLKLIHFDLGANMAYAHNCMGDVVIADHFTAKGTRQERAAQTLSWLQLRFQQMKVVGLLPEAVHYERPFARGMHATRSLWGVAGLVEAVAKQYGLDTFDTTPKEIKKFVAHYKASKEEMIVAARLLGYMGNNEHEADSYCGLMYAIKHIK